MNDHNMQNFAMRTAFARAWNTYAPEGIRICNDTLAEYFLSPEHRSGATTPTGRAAFNSAWTPLERKLLDWVAVRTCVLDMLFQHALAPATNSEHCVEQVVILGAGYDSRAYRLLPENWAGRVFELDRPGMLADKRDKLTRILGSLPPNVAYVPVDFETQDFVSAIVEKGFYQQIPSLFLWEGVSFFLTQKTVEQTIANIARISAPQSVFVFDHAHSCVLENTCQDAQAELLVRYFKEMGEPYTFGIDPEMLGPLLECHGLTMIENHSAIQWLALCAAKTSAEIPYGNLAPADFFHIAHVRKDLLQHS